MLYLELMGIGWLTAVPEQRSHDMLGWRIREIHSVRHRRTMLSAQKAALSLVARADSLSDPYRAHSDQAPNFYLAQTTLALGDNEQATRLMVSMTYLKLSRRCWVLDI